MNAIENKPLLDNKQLEIILRAGPDLDRVEPQLSPALRDTLVSLQRNVADAYAAGDWQVPSTGETITVPESYSRKGASASTPFYEQAQDALGNAYLSMADNSKDILKTMMQELGLTRSAPNPPAKVGRLL